MKLLPVFLVALLNYPLPGAVVLDRIAVIVGKHVVKSSDIERDLRITDFLNAEPLVLTARTKHKAAERLIDQSIIRDEIASGGYQRATDAEASATLDKLRQTRYGGSETRFRQALNRYGITEEELQMELLWQLTVLKFIDQRFRPGVLVTAADVHQYYDEHEAALKRQYPKANSFDALEAGIRASLEGEQINRQFDMWLDDARKRTRIEYMPGAIQ